MSTTVDHRVVEMRFDHSNFKKNTEETMSLLDKLKQKLNFNGASKGLDEINTSAKNVNMGGLANAVQTVQARFSALEVVGVTALANITNSVVNAGKQMLHSLTVAPIKDGWNEYEMTLNAIQTTMAGTGKTAKEVQEQLKKLDAYADKTVYSTADMLNNLPKFTNAGVDLEVATKAMIGIANATAHAGGDASKASIAFYNLGQAIGTGYLTRMDYNSINNAGIATMEWKNQMVEAAIAMGTLTKVGENQYKAGNKTLTLQQLFIDGLQEQWATTDVLIKVFGDYGDETTAIGKAAYSSAQDIKTFSMMMESLKATAGTGWKDTWEIIFGDLDEAKEFWTGITNFISNIIEGVADFRNTLLEGALGRTFTGLFDGIKDSIDSVKEVADVVKDYTSIVDQVIGGNWGTGEERWNALANAGYDWAYAQNLVNEKLGNSLRRATNYQEVQNEVANAQIKSTEATAEYIAALADKTDAELLSILGTEKQVKAFRELQKVARQTGIPLKTFVENIDDIDGRWILINTFKNAVQGLTAVFRSMKEAWVETIGVITSDHLFDFIALLHKLSTHLIVTEEAAGKFKRMFAGVFAVLDILFTLTKGPLALIGKLIVIFLRSLDILPKDLLGTLAVIGDYLVALRDWVDNMLDLTNMFELLSPYIQLFVGKINELFQTIRNTEAWQKFTKGLKETKDVIIAWMKGMLKADDLSKYLFEGLMNGLKSGWKVVIDFIINFAKAIIEGVCETLGIESPSKEFYEIGKNIVLGLFNGIKDFVKMVFNLVIGTGETLTDMIKSLNLGKIFGYAFGGAAIYSLVKLVQAIVNVTNIFTKLDDIAEGTARLLKGLGSAFKGLQFKYIGEGIKSIGIAIGILAASVAVLAMMDQGNVWSAVGAISALVILLGGIVAVSYLMGDKVDVQLGKITLAMIGISIAASIMAKALRTISKIDSEKCIQTLGGLVGVVAALIILTSVIGGKKRKLEGVGKTLIVIAGALVLLAITARMLSGISWTGLAKAGVALFGISALVVGLMAATKLISGSKNVNKIGGALMKIAGALLIMIIVAKIAGNMEPGEMARGLSAIVAFSGIIVGLMAATKLISGSKNVNKIGSAIFGISTALLMMLLVSKIAAGMSPEELTKGVVGITLFSGIVVGLMALVKKIGGAKNTGKLAASIMSISISVGLMALVAALLGRMDIGAIAKGIIAVGLLAAIVTGMIYMTKKAKGVTGTMVAITVAIGILSLALGLLSRIEPGKLMTSMMSLIGVIGAFALLVKATKNVKKAMGSLIVLTVAIGLLATAIILVGKLTPETALASATALATVLLAMTAVLVILDKVGKVGKDAFLGIVGLLALCIPLVALIGILSLMQNIRNAEANVKALGEFMLVLSVVQLLCAAAGAIYTVTAGIAMLGLVGMLALVVVLYALMGVLAIMSNIKNAITNLTALQEFLIVMTQVLVVLSIVGPLALMGVTALAALTYIMGIIGVMAVAIGALMDKIPALEGFLDKGLPILTKLAGGIGTMIGAFVGGALAGISMGLPIIGTNLSKFMDNVSPFIEGAKSIDSKMMDGIKTLAEAFLILSGASIVEGIASWLTGDSSLAGFGEQLGTLGSSLKEFSDNIGTFTDDQVKTVTCACNGIKALAEAAKAIPNEGGLWGAIVGENGLATFAGYLPALATNLAQFVVNLGTFTDTEVESATCAADAIKALAEAAQELPNDGGLWGALCGENSLAKFGGDLPALGTNLSKFITNLGTFTDAQVTTVTCAGNAIKALAEAAQDIPNEGGFWGALCGDNSIATFGTYLPDLATNIAKFVSNLGTFTDVQVTTVTSACDAIRAMAELGNINVKKTGNQLKKFGENMVTFAGKVKTFVDEIAKSSGTAITDAITKTKDLIAMASEVASTNIDSLKTFGKSLKDIAEDGVNGFVEAFSGTAPKTDAEYAVRAMVQSGIDGADGKKSDVEKAFKKLSQAAIDEIATKDRKKEAKQAGKDLVTGFANGIKDNKSLAENAGSELGKAALEAARRTLDEHSPSREAMKIGNYFGQGLVIGIEEYNSKTYNAGYSIAEYAKNGLSKAIARVSKIISSDMDTQPTIRPVLDLSDIEDGASTISSMFNNGPSVGVSANLNAISSGMRLRNQNGVNDDVISAINKLRGDLSNVPRGDTFNVNGVTYDDGTNVSNAVREIIRAAKIERRA